MRKLKDMKIGDSVPFKSHEGIKKKGMGKIVDLWDMKETGGKAGEWTATLECGGGMVLENDHWIRVKGTYVQITDSDLDRSRM